MKRFNFQIVVILFIIVSAVFSLSSCDLEGKSAYDIAVENGFQGTEAEWLDSLKIEGKSAYDIAVENGFQGTEAEWLESLKGLDGEYAGQGLSAYQIAIENGFEGSEAEWLESLKGEKGDIGETSTVQATNKVLNSVVSVYAEFVQTVTNPWTGKTYDEEYSGAGAGVILNDDKTNGTAYIITNYHVVFSGDSNSGVSENIHIYLYGMEFEQYAIDAIYIGGSLNYDIAVLKIENSDIYKNSGAYPVTLSDDTDIYAGSTAIAVGNPEASGISSSTGVVSVDSEYLTMTGADDVTTVTFRVMRIDTAVNSGNSGGGLFNGQGELIGIVNAKISSNDIENIAYAIPTSIAINAANNIIRNCDGGEHTSILRCMVGIELNIDESYSFYDEEESVAKIIQTISVKTISEESIANGILQTGDIIESFTYDGKTIDVNRVYTIVDYSLNFVEGHTLTFNIVRSGVSQSVSVTLGAPTVIA